MPVGLLSGVRAIGELAPLHPRNNTFPGEVFLHLAADVLDWCDASRTGPLPPLGIQEVIHRDI